MSSNAADFSGLYQRYSRDVYRFSLYLGGDPALAEDITAETFLRVWSSAQPLRPATVKGYLLAIARNLFLHEMRRRERISPLEKDVATAQTLQHDAEVRTDLARVVADLQKLSEIDRAAVLLRAQDELPYEEIGAVLGISPAAAKLKVHRARLRLSEWQRRSVTTP